MNHEKIQKKILIYLDGDLSENERKTMEEHFISCSHCSKRLEVFSTVWKLERTAGQKKPSPYLWTRLEERIKKYDYNGSILTDLKKQFDFFLRPAALFLLLIMAVVAGNYLGNISFTTASVDLEKEIKKELVRIYHIDAFEPFTPESIDKVLNIASDVKRSEAPQ